MRIDCINWCRAGYMTSENGLFSFADCVMIPKTKGELKKLAFYMDGQLWEARWAADEDLLVMKTNDYHIKDAEKIIDGFRGCFKGAAETESGEEVFLSVYKNEGEGHCEILVYFYHHGE